MADMQSYIREFQAPRSCYRPSVMWFWNDEIRKDEITFQLEQFLSQGIYDFFIHSMYGLTLDYLSDEFFDLIRFTVAEAKRLGLKFWIYDEFNWPSGQAGGKVIEKHPWARACAIQKTDGRKAGRSWQADCEGELMSAVLLREAELAGQAGQTEQAAQAAQAAQAVQAQDVTARVERTDGRLVINLRDDEEGRVQFFCKDPLKAVLATAVWGKYSTNQGGLCDLFNAEAAGEYLDLTYGGYKKAVGDEFGQTVIGSFTDEDYPSSPFEIGEGRVPWTPGLDRIIFERYGIDIKPCLYMLYRPSRTEMEIKVKNMFWSTLKELYFQNFVRPLAAVCRENNLILTGHFQGGGGFAWDATEIGNIFEGLTLMDAPGFDAVAPMGWIDRPGFSTLIASRIRTVCKYYQKSRVICESFSGSGWHFTFEDMKRVTNLLLLGGANNIQYMGAYYSLDSGRKILPMGYPPSHGYNNPLFAWYHDMADYIAGPSYLSAVTQSTGRILVFIPLAEAKQRIDLNEYLIQDYLKPEFSIRSVDEVLENLFDAFLRLGIGYDFVPEELAPEIEIGTGALTLKGFTYDTVVFPDMEYSREEVIKLYGVLKNSGVRILLINREPHLAVESGKDFGQSGALSLENQAGDLVLYRDGPVSLIKNQAPTIDPDHFRSLVQMLISRDHALPGFEPEGRVFAIQRENADIGVCFLVNDEDREVTVHLSSDIPGLKLFSARGKALEPETAAGQITFRMDPFSLVVGISDRESGSAGEDLVMEKPEKPDKPEKQLEGEPDARPENEPHLLDVGNLLEFRPLEENKLLPQVYLSFPGQAGEHSDACKRIAFDDDLPEALDLGQPYSVKFIFTVRDPIDPLYLNLEVGDVEAIRVNGHSLDCRANARIWGVHNWRQNIAGLVQTGANEVILDCRLPDWKMLHKIPYGFLSGAFLVREDQIAGEGPLVGPGDLSRQGYPYYSGQARYSLDYTCHSGDAQQVVIDIDSCSPLEITVNGVRVKRLLWKPFRADITAFLNKGRNKVDLTITESYANLFSYKVKSGIQAVRILTSEKK
ncbi:MAG TPA: hypothetical protein DD640_01590 [Clostridiales bacterium]|nr:hypothetical protein [Clostridiales bacterium]